MKKNVLAVVWSPLQLMCFHAALQLLGDIECRIIILKDSNSTRHNQIEIMAKLYGFSYCLSSLSENMGRYRMLAKNFLRSFLPNNKKVYDYLFIGDYRFASVIGAFFHLLKSSSHICFLEDGNISLPILLGLYKDVRIEQYYKVLNPLCKFRHISISDYYSIYTDVTTKRFNIVDITTFFHHTKENAKSGVYFLGTNSIEYYNYLKISKNEYLQKLKKALLELKKCYGEDVVYIPHGRDTLSDVPILCKECNIEYRPIDVCFEFYCFSHSINPIAVCGFSSSALMTMHFYSANSSVINYIDSAVLADPIYRIIVDYYRDHGIITIKF